MSTMKLLRNQKIVAAVKAGATLQQVGDTFGVTPQRIRQICEREGVRSVRAHFALNPEIKAQIVALYERGMPIAHIAEDIGRSPNAVFDMLVRLRIHKPADDDRPWSDADADFLRKSYHKTRVRHIANILGRTRNEVIGKARRLGLHSANTTQRRITVAQQRRAKVRDMRQRGMTLRAIADALDTYRGLIARDVWTLKQAERQSEAAA